MWYIYTYTYVLTLAFFQKKQLYVYITWIWEMYSQLISSYVHPLVMLIIKHCLLDNHTFSSMKFSFQCPVSINQHSPGLDGLFFFSCFGSHACVDNDPSDYLIEPAHVVSSWSWFNSNGQLQAYGFVEIITPATPVTCIGWDGWVGLVKLFVLSWI